MVIITFTLKLIADLLEWALHPVVYPISIIILIVKCMHKKDFTELKKYNYNLGYTKDIYGNVLISPIANIVLLKKTSIHKFGSIKNTISSTLGKNIARETARKSAYFICKILNIFDRNHCIKSAVNYKE